MKVLLNLKCKGVKLLVNEAFDKKRTPAPEHGSRYRQRSSVEFQAARGVRVANPA
jgi:hypothetical protein